MILILMRHLETAYSVEHRICGQMDIPILEGQIIKVSREVMDRVKGHKVKIFSSPLIRCIQTAEILASEIGIKCIDIVQGLKERNWGKLCGMTKAEIILHYGKNLGELVTYNLEIESEEIFNKRLKESLTYIFTLSEDICFVVSHQGCLRRISVALGYDDKKFYNGEYRIYYIDGEENKSGC